MPITLSMEDGAALELGGMSEFIGSAYAPQVAITDTDTGHEVAITYDDAATGITTKTVDVADGHDGADGYSPTATVTQLTDGATIRITDKDGTTTATVSNGADGSDGADGFSPTVDVQPIEGGHEVTITDAQGPHSFDVMDGQGSSDPVVSTKVNQLWGNQLKGTLTGDVLTASDAYAAPPMSLVVDGRSTQDGTPTPEAPVPIESVDGLSLELHDKQLMDWEHPFRTGSYNYDIAVGSVITPATSANVEVSMSDGTLVSVIKAAWNGAIWRSPNLPNGTYYIRFPVAAITNLTGTSLGSTLFVVDKNNKCVRKIGTHAATGNWNWAITLSGDEAAICVNAGTRSGTRELSHMQCRSLN